MRISRALLDANVMALLIVGSVSEREIPRCRRTRHYSVDDYHILVEYMESFQHVAITPNIATEVSNLIGVLYGDYLLKARNLLAAGLRIWEEEYVPSIDASANRYYGRLGLTDAALLSVARQDTEIITDDFDLYSCLAASSVPVTNFTHLRAQHW